MTTNREWLYALDVADLTDWFDAEHVDDDGVSRSNDGVAAEHETDNTRNNSCGNVTDSRTQLVADIYAWLESNVGFSVWLTDLIEQVRGWLDRQAAITERELTDELDEYERIVDRLTAERDNLADDLLACNREREHLRKNLGIALDHAHDICALVDIGE